MSTLRAKQRRAAELATEFTIAVYEGQAGRTDPQYEDRLRLVGSTITGYSRMEQTYTNRAGLRFARERWVVSAPPKLTEGEDA